MPVDGEGLDVAAGIARCAAGARAAYVTPSHQYPLGVTMSAARRLQLLDWAQRSGAWILEDDYDSEYRYESLPDRRRCRGSTADARVIYIGTFSKVLVPRPAARLPRDPARIWWRASSAVREAMDICRAPLYQAVLTDFIARATSRATCAACALLYARAAGALVAALQERAGRRAAGARRARRACT